MDSSRLYTSLANLGSTLAVISLNGSLTYNELNHGWEHQKTRLQDIGIHPDSVVVLEADYNTAAVAALIALLSLKTTTVPINSLPDGKHEEILATSGARSYVELNGTKQKIHTLESVDEVSSNLYDTLRTRGVVGLALFNSGITGNSKGAALDFDRIIDAYENSNCKPQRTIIFLGFDHIGGISTLFYALTHGSMIVTIQERTPDGVLNIVGKATVGVLPATPTFLTMYLVGSKFNQYDLSSLQIITYGTEPMPEQTLQKLHEALPEVKSKQTCGLSELGIMSTKSKSDNSLWVKLGGPGFSYKIIDDALWIKSERAMLGYLNASYRFDDDGFFNTQGQIEIDNEYAKILGRKSEIINVGGLKVYPSEVESALLEVRGVIDILMFGQADAVTGQVAQAKVRPSGGIDIEMLKSSIKQRCAEVPEDYKRPVAVGITTADPHSERFKKAHV